MGTVETLLRAATVDDAEALAIVAAQTFCDGWASVVGDATARAYAAHCLNASVLRTELADTRSYYFPLAVQEKTGSILGYAKLDLVRPAPACVTGPAPAALQRLYMVEAGRGRGIADCLLHAVADEALRRERHTLWLECDRRNARAWRFYEKRGFLSVGTTVYHLPEGENDQVEIMTRSFL